ncbi:MAG: DUF1810 domain-containing protein [Acidobacteriaceae bacterium]
MTIAKGDPYNLQRFVEAQAPVYPQVCAELRRGRKTGHWIWFIFPQIRGLGSSETSRYFAISCREEAKAYLDHPVLGPRLRECTRLVTGIPDQSIDRILSYPDNLKFQSSMTLFAHAVQENEIFLDALHKYFGGAFDPQTLVRI